MSDEMKEESEGCIESLRYIAGKPEGRAKISELKEALSPPLGHWDPRVIGALCAGNTPNCKLDGAFLVITEQGKLSVASYEGKTISSEPKAPKAPKPKPETVKTDFLETNQEV
jgi:hypothetical protein